MPLLPLLRDEAKRRGLLAEGEALDLATVYRLVRDMPYGGGVDEAPEAVLRAWRGSAAGKHDLLSELLDDLGLVAMTVIATHQYDAESTPWLPPHLLTEANLAPVPDVHTFLRVEYDPIMHEWMTMDATWPAGARRLGLPANPAFDAGRDQVIASDPIEFFHVPDDMEPAELRERILADHVGSDGARREAFLKALAEWIASELR
jgi:hypothetical protein